MKRGIHNLASLAVRELNRWDSHSSRDGATWREESSAARWLRAIVVDLQNAESKLDAFKWDLGMQIGQKPPKHWALYRLAADRIESLTVISARASSALDLLKGRAYRAGQAIVSVCLAGKVQRFRECRRCRKWFYAARGNQRVCSNSCRSLLWQMGKGRKKHNATYKRWRIRNVVLPHIEDKLRELPHKPPLSERRKQFYLDRQAQWKKKLSRLEAGRKSIRKDQ